MIIRGYYIIEHFTEKDVENTLYQKIFYLFGRAYIPSRTKTIIHFIQMDTSH